MNPLFQERTCLSPQEINGYLQEALKKETIHEIENHLLDCALCRDAVDGVALLDDPEDSAFFLEYELSEALPPEEKDDEFAELVIRKSIKEAGKDIIRHAILPPMKYFAVAASFALMLILGWLITHQQPQNERLFLSYYVPVQALDLEQRGVSLKNSEKTRQEFILGGQAYNQKRFDLSALYFERVVEARPYQDTARFFLALSLLETDQARASIPHFQALVEQNEHPFFVDAQWYHALAQLKENQLDHCQEQLNAIVQGNGPYREKATSLLDKLN